MTVNGYDCVTTFWSDFSIADHFGPAAVEDTYRRAFNEWKENTVYLTELVMVLNWKAWQHDGLGKRLYAKLYSELYYEADDWAHENLKGDDLSYYYKTAD